MDDLQQVILDELRATRSDLKAHIRDEDSKFEAIKKDVRTIQQDVALAKQRSNIITSIIATAVAAIVSFFSAFFARA